MKHTLGRVARNTQRAVVWSLGGYLPEAFSRRSTLIAATVAAFLLVAFPSTVLAVSLGAILTAMVWLSEMVLALTTTPEASARHSTISIPYMALLAVGAGAVYAAHSDDLPWLMWLSLLLLVISTWLASSVPVLASTKPLIATNFNHNPEVTTPSGLQIKGLLRTIWGVFGILGILAFTSVSLAPWVAFVLSIVAAALTIRSTIGALRYAELARWRTLRELRKLHPTVVIPYGGNATYQAEMWYPYIDQLDEPYYIVSLTEKTMKRLEKNTNRPIVVPDDQTATDVRRLVPASVKIAYYPHNASKNSLFRADRRYAHVFVHHGDGDKAPSFNPNSAKYDYLFVAGQGAIDRYARNGIAIPDSKFRIIGRPQTQNIAIDRTPIAEKMRPAVLYAPTWYGKNEEEDYSSLTYGPTIIRALIERDVNIIFRPHPASRSLKQFKELIDQIQEVLRRDSEQSDRQHIWGDQAEKEWTVSEVTNASDAMIADVSGIVTDYLQSGKPYAMATVRFNEKDFQENFPTSRSSYVITPNAGALSTALDGLLGDDPLSDLRWKKRSYYLGGFEGNQAVRNFITESKSIMDSW